MNTIFIIKNGNKIGEIALDDEQWKEVNYLDYVDVDNNGKITDEFESTHGKKVYSILQAYCTQTSV